MELEYLLELDLLIRDIDQILESEDVLLEINLSDIKDSIWNKISDTFSKIVNVYKKVSEKIDKYKVAKLPESKYKDIEHCLQLVQARHIHGSDLLIDKYISLAKSGDTSKKFKDNDVGRTFGDEEEYNTDTDIISEIEKIVPDIKKSIDALEKSNEYKRLNEDEYSKDRQISIDYNTIKKANDSDKDFLKLFTKKLEEVSKLKDVPDSGLNNKMILLCKTLISYYKTRLSIYKILFKSVSLDFKSKGKEKVQELFFKLKTNHKDAHWEENKEIPVKEFHRLRDLAIDFVYKDGDKNFDACEKDFQEIAKILNVGNADCIFLFPFINYADMISKGDERYAVIRFGYFDKSYQKIPVSGKKLYHHAKGNKSITELNPVCLGNSGKTLYSSPRVYFNINLALNRLSKTAGQEHKFKNQDKPNSPNQELNNMYEIESNIDYVYKDSEMGGNACYIKSKSPIKVKKVDMDKYKKEVDDMFKESYQYEDFEALTEEDLEYYREFVSDSGGVTESLVSLYESKDEDSDILKQIKEFNKELNSWDYGVLVNGKVITDSSKVDWSKYKTIPIKDIEKYHVGICWDFVNYEFDWFNKKRIGTETYMFVMQKSDDPQDIVTHTFLIFNLEGKKYWFESSWFGHQGVKEVKSYKDVVKELVDKYGDHSYSVYKYNPKGLDNHVDNGEFFRKTTKNLVDNYVVKENHIPLDYLTEKAVEQLDEALNLGDMLLLFNEDAKNDALLKKLLYTGRMKTRKDLLEYYEMVKNDNPWIRYAYPEINRFQKRNLFIDTSYYNNLFFNNNTWTMKKGLGIFFDYMERVLKHASLKETGYEKLTIMIPVLGWGAKEDLWNYRQSLNPISMIYQYMYTGNLTQLRKVFGDTDIIFVASDKYFKINFKDITASDIKKYALKFKVFILKIVKNEVFDPEDIDTTADNVDSPEVVQAKIADKIEDSRGVDITPQLAKARSGSNTPVKTEKPKPGSVTKTRLNQKEDPEKESQERAKQKIADNIVYNTKDEVNNTEDDVLDSLDNSETKALILDLDPEDEDGVVVSPGRVTRMNQLNDKFLQSNVKGQTIRDILADESNKKEVKTDLKVSTPFDDWKQLEYVNFDKNYNLDKDILACFRHLQTVSRPISIRKIEVKDNSTSEDRVELYTVNMEDYRGKQFTVKLDIPIMVDNRFLLRGNHKSIQTQFFNMPIIKTEEDTVQIISNYMKIFVRRFRTGNGRALPETARLVKALHNYKGREVKVETGDNSKVCSKYNLPIDYIDLASEFTKIETPERVIYFNQDEMYKEHGDKIDSSKGVPYLYIKKNKGIAYYSPVDECTFTQAILGELGLDPACLKIRTLFDEAKAPSVCTFSRASILNSQIPLVVICAYHVGLRSTLDRAGIEYKISEKLSKDDKLLYGDYLKFKDGYVFYKPTYSSSMLLNGLKESNLSDYSLSEIDSRTMYLELLDNYGGRIKADGLDNFRDLMVDPMTKETLEFYHMPTDYIDILIYANNLLADNKFIKHTDVSSRRLRRYQLIAVYTYKVLADAYYNYSIQLKHTENVAEFMIKQSAVIDKFLTDTITSDDSVINALRDLETTNSITTKGPSGMNADRAYSLDKRTYDDSMLNVVGMSTGFASNVGITRQATMNANITPDGYVKTIDGKTDKMNTANTLTATEALTPFGSTHDDPMRTAMTFIQTAKHQVRTVESDPLLVTNGSDEALPYMSSDRFAFKAKKKGKVEELTDDYMIIKYLDGTKDFINLMKTIEKNSDGGYYVALKLDKSTNIKVGSNVEPGQIVAYDKESYSNSAGETDNLTYNIGKLGKIAILNTDEGFEDSGIISNRMAEALATPIDYKFDQIIDKDSIIYDIVKVGDHVEVGDALLTYQSPFDDEDANALMKMMGDGSDVSELGKRKITSEITGTVTAIKMFRTVETSEMSDSLKKIVNAYEKPLKEMKKKLEENNLDTSQVPAHYVLPAVGKLKKAEDAVLIEIYVEYLDTIGPGDKVVYFSANKAVEKNIFPVGKEPYTAYRPNEIIDGFVSETSIMKRMVCSTLTIGSINKLMIELDRHVKDIMGIPYDDSKV